MPRMKKDNFIGQKAGFTLVETLLVVAVLVALMGISVVGIGRLVGDIRQKEMDAKAELIYQAAQNRLAKLQANGGEIYYQNRPDMEIIDRAPMDYDPSISDEEYDDHPLYYVNSGDKEAAGSAAFAILPRDSVEFELWDHHWIIEYEPGSGRVYAVFYSETRELVPLKQDGTLDTYRYRQVRRDAGGYVGFYGGDVVLDAMVSELSPVVTVENGEKLVATFQCPSPGGEALVFDISVTDGTNTFTKTVTPKTARVCKYEWVMDSLDEQFKDQLQGLTPGKDITITFTARSVSNPTIDQKTSDPVTTNSLFGYTPGTPGDTALILCGRHLQNLDTATSGVHTGITRAVQQQDISFLEEAGNEENWYACYGDRVFTPIDNQSLTAYTGSYQSGGITVSTSIRGLKAEGAGNGGLFHTIYKGSYTDICLISSTVRAGENAGVLAGAVSGEVVVRNCQAYLNVLDTYQNKNKIWVSGGNAGGLVGLLPSGGSLAVYDSFAATVLEADAWAAGLVGRAEGALTLTGSYGDCYVTGNRVAGLATASRQVSVTDCYAAGYLFPGTEAAGLVLGSGALTNAYTACFYEPRNEAAVIYTTAVSGEAVNTYYLKMTGEELAETTSKTYGELSDRGAMAAQLGEGFTAQVVGSDHPYNLRNQGLTDYSFPRLKKLPHYGDWQAEFESGKLVYFEVYDGNEVGFFGATIDTLNTSGYVKGDGYGIVYNDTSALGGAVEIFVDDTAYQLTDQLTTTVGGQEYTIFTLPAELVSSAPGASFYRTLRVPDTDGVEESVYYFNPHFARAFTGSADEAPAVVYVRSARQLYLLSLYSGSYASLNFYQEMDICYHGQNGYDWAAHGIWGGTVKKQGPIGTAAVPFSGSYDGGYKQIDNLNISSRNQHIGLFGYVGEKGRVANVRLLHDYDPTTGQGGSAGYDGGINQSNVRIYLGTIVGCNQGIIHNCAVTGYTSDLNVYQDIVAYQGGLVGLNETGGIITNCSVVGMTTKLNVNDSYAYVGGFVGMNRGSIDRCYGLGAFDVKASQSSSNYGSISTYLSGFAGQNNMGSIRNSYCATSLTGSGQTATSAFTPSGGNVKNSYYLSNGAYYLAGTLHAFQSNPANTDGGEKTDAQMKAMTISGFDWAQESPLHPYTAGDSYPYPAVVRDASGRTVHHGDWYLPADLGTFGVFYWEKEEDGSNDGIHFSYICIHEDGTISNDKNLCTAHDDGGRITSYGYGYFYAKNQAWPESVTFGGKDVEALGLAEATDIAAALEAQLPDFEFVPYLSGADQLKPDGAAPNLPVVIKDYNGESYTFTVSPFFGDALAYEGKANVRDDKPGTELNPYQVRSPEQLQFINWNHNTGNAMTSIDSSNKENENIVKSYTYLRYLFYVDGENDKKSDDTHSGYNYYWDQSHDVDFDQDPYASDTFIPIGSMYDDLIEGNTSEATTAYFAGSYDGNDYLIQNVEINSQVSCTGLFGITMEANLNGIALYSDRGNLIRVTGGSNWYCLGGLVGFAGRGTAPASITNCTVAGYHIEDHRSNNGGWGGANIGGLVGASNMPISNCTAITDILVKLSYNRGYNNVRVGGLIGGLRSTVSSCYAGGSIVSTVPNYGTDQASSTSVWIGGIVGGIVMRNEGNFSGLVGTVDVPVSVSNCYSYVELPAGDNTNQVRSSLSIASNGELQSGAFADYVSNQSVIIENCYCLKDVAGKTNDYRNFSSHTNWDDVTLANYGDRAVIVNNPRSPYLSYDEMCAENGMLAYLGGRFGTVTIEENNAQIPGKFTFPANAAYLKGSNYPFPTILTQEDRFTVGAQAGSTVNVHYGRWPLTGLSWWKTLTELDILVHDETTADRYPEQKVELIVAEKMTLTPEDFLYDGGTDAKIAKVIAVSEAVQIAGDQNTELNGKYRITVTLAPLSVGEVRITPNKAGHICDELRAKVVAQLVVHANPNRVDQCVNDETTVVFTATNRDSTKDLTDQVTWNISKPEDGDVAYVPDDGIVDNRITIIGNTTEGETYMWAEASYDSGGVVVSGEKLVLVSTRTGVIGLSNGAAYNQAVVDGYGGTGADVADPAGLPTGTGLFLYSDFNMGDFRVTDVTVKSEGTVLEGTIYSVGQAADCGGYYCSELIVAGSKPDGVELTVTLERGREKYILSLPHIELTPTYTITFRDDNGMLLGEAVAVKDGTLEQVTPPADPVKAGHRFVGWYEAEHAPFDPTLTVTRDMTFIAWYKQVYTVTFADQDGTVLDTQEVLEGEQAVRPADPAAEGLVFHYWMQPDGTEYRFDQPVADNITLTAKYKQVYTVTFVDEDGASVLWSQKAAEGDAVTPQQIPGDKGNRTFDCWTTDGNTVYDLTTAVTGDITLIAKYKQRDITITIDPNGGWYDGSTGMTTITIQSGTRLGDAGLSTPTRNNRSFAGWRVNGANVDDDYILEDGDVLEAQWKWYW